MRIGRGGARAGGEFLTAGTVVGLVGAIALTLFGVGAANHAIANVDASSWLWSSRKGEVARVNGVTGRVDTRLKLAEGQGHPAQVSQSDRYVVLRDPVTGRVSVLDLASLRIAATTQTTSGVGVSLALYRDAAFVIDAVQGTVSQLDPATLRPIGDPLRFPPGLAGGVFDGAGRLWLLVPGEGTVVAIRPAPNATGTNGAGPNGSTAAGDPSVVQTVDVGDPSHDLAMSVLDNGVAVLDQTAAVLTTVRGDATRTVTLPLSGLGLLPERTSGPDVPVTVVDDRHVYVLTGTRITQFTVPGDNARLKPCLAWAGRFYCADEALGGIYVLDQRGRLVNTISMLPGGGALELEVREEHLFVNAPDASTARVVDDHGRVKVVDKYANNILGGDPPPNPPPPPPAKPAVGPPGPPASVTASAGNASARVTWTAAPPNGSAILKYVIAGDGKVREVGANQRTVEITGLANGQRYQFTVHAVNGKGAGPNRAANPVVPTSDVPDPPASVSAVEKGDGTVTVSWPPGNGLGRQVVRYQVTAISAGASEVVGESTTTSLVIPAGRLGYGTQYAFTVISINDKGAGSKPSPVSNTVVPYARPSAPRNLAVTTGSTQRGTIAVQWQPAADNGRPITTYVVDAGTVRQDVTSGTSVTLGGFADGATVRVSVTAVNAAGPGPAASGTATTIRPPAVTVTGVSAGYNTVTVAFTTDNGGSPNTTGCTLVVGTNSATGNCTGLTVAGLWPGNTYQYRLTVTNAAGSATATGSQATPLMYGTVLCATPSYCGRGAPNGGIWVYTTPNQNGTSVGDVYAPDRYQATCWTYGNATINALPYGGKQDSRWIRIKFRGDNYIPFAWFRLDGGDNPAMLPRC